MESSPATAKAVSPIIEAAPGPPQTGRPDIDAALARLVDLDQADVAAHPARLDEVHQVLRGVLQETPAANPTGR